jgi:uracil-DNA glycosylase family 4
MIDKPLPGQHSLFSEEILLRPDPARLVALKALTSGCKKCPLYCERTNIVFGEGCATSPDIAFVGEAPGEEDAAVGRPFMGAPGALLDGMIRAMGLTRETVYICNTVLCRPTEAGRNRKPTRGEIALCYEWFVGQLRCVQPKVIVALGSVAINALMGTKKDEPLHKFRGEWLEWQRRPLRASFHPAYLLKVPDDKLKAWEDLQAVLKLLKETGLAIPRV